MNRFFDILLMPVSWVYALVVQVRNWLYDKEVLKSKSFDLAVIVVGNLSAGGSGKTPHVEYLLSMLQADFRVAVLSRGYKRKSKGFVEVTDDSAFKLVGDEAYQIKRKYPDAVVAVCENRVEGITRLLRQYPDIQVVVLDDGFQHRALKPGLSILLTDYQKLYTRDKLLPVGRLRESAYSSLRADIIIVTKCPEDIKPIDLRVTESELKPMPYQSLYFSKIKYESLIPVFENADTEILTLEKIKDEQRKILLVAGIVSPQHIIQKLKTYTDDIESFIFPDHYLFTKKDLQKIEDAFEESQGSRPVIITTEKDAARLIEHTAFAESLKPFVYSLPIQIDIINKEKSLIQKIKNYVGENTRNS